VSGFMKLSAVLFGAVVTLALAVWWQWPDQYMHLITCDVGQGDATLITYGFHQVLIDAGPDDLVMECLSKHLPWWDRTLELIVMTHADADHIGGLPAVLDRYKATELLFTPYYKDTALFKEVMGAVRDEYETGALIDMPILGQQFRLPQVEKGLHNNFVRNSQSVVITSLFPRVDTTSRTVENWLKTETQLWDTGVSPQVISTQIDDHNDRSIVLLLEFGKTSALLTGDLEKGGELSLLAEGLTDQVDILKAGHHGSNTSTTRELLTKTRPEVSLVSAGLNNKYGHPSPEVLARLIEFDVEIWRTDELGTIEVVSDGEEYWIKTEKK
jgi:competence protein ComEC